MGGGALAIHRFSLSMSGSGKGNVSESRFDLGRLGWKGLTYKLKHKEEGGKGREQKKGKQRERERRKR